MSREDADHGDRVDELYEQDFYVWTQRQAEALRRLAEPGRTSSSMSRI